MKNLILIIVCFSWFSVQAAELFDDKLLIRFTDDTKAIEAEQIVKDAGLRLTNIMPEIQLYVAKPEEKFTEVKLGDLKSNPKVMYAEPNHMIRANVTPNDPKHSGDVLQLRAAWDTTTGSKNVIVAVSDTGVRWTHEDLANQIWTNTGEIDGNGIDDDNNGFIDDVHGWNFYSKNNKSNDDHRHGTHVSGIIGAEGNNGKGIAGANWAVTIMPIKFLSAGGSGSSEGGVQTILYAANNGARIINASWGGDSFNQAMYDAIVYAGTKGALFVAAAGNAGKNTDSTSTSHYPSGYKLANVISVCSASSTNSNSVSTWSNRGRKSVHICAPGLNITSSVISSNKAYARLSGTSMAAPAISGIAALILSVHPELNPFDLRNAVLNGVRGSKLPVSSGGIASADISLKQFQGGPQIWPGQFIVAKNSKLKFTPYGFGGAVKWSIDNPAIATIDDTGTLTAVAVGKVTVTATGGSNQVATTRSIQVLK